MMQKNSLSESALLAERDRFLEQIKYDPFYSRKTMGLKDVLLIHFELLRYFAEIGEGVGGIGPKDMKLLESALSRQFTQFDGHVKWKGDLELCATLCYGLVKNHPFHDANKRTAFLTLIIHLARIGRTPSVSGDFFEDLMVQIAENTLLSNCQDSKKDFNGDVAVS